MVPTVGRIVHVGAVPGIDCRAAIVNSLDHLNENPATVYVSVFNPHNAISPVTNAVVDSNSWHDPKECPRILGIDADTAGVVE